MTSAGGEGQGWTPSGQCGTVGAVSGTPKDVCQVPKMGLDSTVTVRACVKRKSPVVIVQLTDSDQKLDFSGGCWIGVRQGRHKPTVFPETLLTSL